MDVVIDGVHYIPKPESDNRMSADNDEEAYKLWINYEPLCPECSRRAFPTKFPHSLFGGEKKSKRTVWFCSDNGHCAFTIDKNVKWQKKNKK